MFFVLNRSALPITETELKLIAKAAIIGESNIPKNGNKTHAKEAYFRYCAMADGKSLAKYMVYDTTRGRQ